MTEIFPNLEREMNILVQKTPNTLKLKWATMRHTIIKWSKVRERF